MRRALLLLVGLVGCRTSPPPDVLAAPEPASSPAPSSIASAPAPSPSGSASAALAPAPVAPAPAPIAGATVTGTSYRLTAAIHASLPLFTFELEGKTKVVGKQVHISAQVLRDIPDGDFPCAPRCAERELGPAAVVVTDAAGRKQTLKRGYPKARDDWGAEPQALELTAAPTFGKNVGAGDLALADYDADGYLDLEVHMGRINDGRGKLYQYKQVWLYDPKSGDFREMVDAHRHSQLSLESPGCVSTYYLGVVRFLTVYEVRKGRLFQVASGSAGYYPADPIEWSLKTKGSRCVTVRPNDTVVASP